MNEKNTLKRSLTETNQMLNGLGVATVTPLTESGVIDEKALELHIKRLDPYVDYYVLGSTAEIASLRPEDKKRLVELVCRHTLKPVVIYAVGLSLHDIMRDVDIMMNSQVVAVMHSMLGYQKPNQEEIMLHFDFFSHCVAEKHMVPTLVYDVPSRTGLPLNAEIVKYLARNSNICGLKDANGEYFDSLKDFASDEFIILCGDDPNVKKYLNEDGPAKGLVSVVANGIPEVSKKYVDFILKGGRMKVFEIQDMENLFYEFCNILLFANPAGIKLFLSEMYDWFPLYFKKPLLGIYWGHVEDVKSLVEKMK